MSGCCVLVGVSVGPLYIRPVSPLLAVADALPSHSLEFTGYSLDSDQKQTKEPKTCI